MGCFKRKERESKTSHEKKMKEKEKKKSPPEKQTISPQKGQLPVPTYNRMKFAYRTTWADVDDDYRFAIGIKKASCRIRGFGKGVLFPFPAFCWSHTPEDEVTTKLNQRYKKVNN